MRVVSGEELTILITEHEAEWWCSKLNFCVNSTAQEMNFRALFTGNGGAHSTFNTAATLRRLKLSSKS